MFFGMLQGMISSEIMQILSFSNHKKQYNYGFFPSLLSHQEVPWRPPSVTLLFLKEFNWFFIALLFHQVLILTQSSFQLPTWPECYSTCSSLMCLSDRLSPLVSGWILMELFSAYNGLKWIEQGGTLKPSPTV